MKNENTLENKIKFFGLYLGQFVAKETKYPNSPTVRPISVFHSGETPGYHLELKPLESISDEEAIDWYEKYCPEHLRKAKKSDLIRWNSDFDTFYPKMCKDLFFFVLDRAINIEIIDYLRSKGYSMPFMDLSIQDLIDYGWIKLIEK